MKEENKNMLVCKICNPNLKGNDYCGEHSTGGTAYDCRPKVIEDKLLKEETLEERLDEIEERKKADKERYWSPCSGCPEGHSSFHRTITESPQWKKWEKEVSRRRAEHNKNKSKVYTGCWDVDECRECGWISQKHFQDFLKFIKEQ